MSNYTSGRKAVHVFLDPGEKQAMQAMLRELGVTTSAVFAVLVEDLGELMTDDRVARARRLTIDRLSRRA